MSHFLSCCIQVERIIILQRYSHGNWFLYVERCAGCKRELGEEFLNFSGKSYHNSCFMCSGCQTPFGSAKVFIKDAAYLCEACVSGCCFKCKRPIGNSSVFEVANKTYHEQCFTCSKCNCALPDGVCTLLSGLPHCAACAKAPQVRTPGQAASSFDPGLCGACDAAIDDDYCEMPQLTHRYHKPCFTCESCFTNLSKPGTQIFVNANKPHCRACMLAKTQS
jgi:hypothetical protein